MNDFGGVIAVSYLLLWILLVLTLFLCYKVWDVDEKIKQLIKKKETG